MIQSFWSFAWPQEKDESPQSPETIPEEKRSWASVFEHFREKGENSETNSASSDLKAFRSFARRAHQLLERQQQRAIQSRRAALHESSLRTERLSLALAEAEELEDLLKQVEPSSKVSESDVERLSGWSTSASSTRASGVSGASGSSGAASQPVQLLSGWEGEDVEARQKLGLLQSAMSQAAGELRSGLLRLSKDSPKELSEDFPGILATFLPQLAQSCADAMQVGEDDWATAEACLLEALAQTSQMTMTLEPADPDFCMPDLDHSTLFTEMPGVQLLEEQRDQRALQKLLERIEALSQRFQSEAPPPVPEAARGQGLKGLKVQTLRSAKLDELEGQVQRLVEENQALEERLEQERARVESPPLGWASFSKRYPFQP
ncbi:unnamed protein product [Durusdinium trenchii]|uniref:Uncharacterized protein n=2 Tax=Durusdinium trenchii TaxID=1381693 RepID=A0ABP0NQK1_9DINO